MRLGWKSCSSCMCGQWVVEIDMGDHKGWSPHSRAGDGTICKGPHIQQLHHVIPHQNR